MTIRFTAAAHTLAQAIYYARAQAFDLADMRHWEALDHPTKRLYIEQAQAVLNANRPVANSSALFNAAVGMTRQHAKVIARITPSEPWGESN